MRRAFTAVVAATVGLLVDCSVVWAQQAPRWAENAKSYGQKELKSAWMLCVLVGAVIVLLAFRKPAIMWGFVGAMVVSGIFIWGIDGIANSMDGLARVINR